MTVTQLGWMRIDESEGKSWRLGLKAGRMVAMVSDERQQDEDRDKRKRVLDYSTRPRSNGNPAWVNELIRGLMVAMWVVLAAGVILILIKRRSGG